MNNAFWTADLAQTDPEIADVLTRELHRQQDHIELIASENIVSHAVLQAIGSVLTNKYAEGYPAHRYRRQSPVHPVHLRRGGIAGHRLYDPPALSRADRRNPNAGPQAARQSRLGLP